MMNSEEVLLCHHCGKIFYKLSSLESHTKWKHMEKSNDFMCEQCGKTFHKKFNLIKHLASGVHQITESVKCALCEFRTLTRKIMCGHYRNFHKIALNERNAYFNTSEDFFSWKFQYENQTRSRFVKMSSSRQRKNGFLRSTYFCHRDGNFIPKGKNLRHLKIKGSNKINAHCPAKIEVEMGENIIIVSYIDTHLGHDLDITRMNLDPAERSLIAEKLALKVPFEQILDEINSKIHENSLSRINLLTRKDLWNIVETFKINPKNVVYSKTRMRRKRKLDQPKIESRKNKVYLKVRNDISNKNQNGDHSSSSVIKTEEVDEQEIENHDINEDNHFLYPIIFQNENNEDVVCNEEDCQYVVISDENIAEDGTCLIINSKGEVESISGHQVVYSDDDGIEICQDNGIQICEEDESRNANDYCAQPFEISDVKTEADEVRVYDGDEVQVYDGDEVQVCEDNEVQIFDNDEIQVLESDEVHIFEDDSIQISGDGGFQICEDNEIEIYEVDEEINNDSESKFCESIESKKFNDLQVVNIDPNKSEHSYINKSGNKLKAKKREGSKTALKKKGKGGNKPTSPVITIRNEEYQVICSAAMSNDEDIRHIDEVKIKVEGDSEICTNVDNKSSPVIFEEISMEQVPEYEVTIGNFEGNDSSDYLVKTDSKEDVEFCNLDPGNDGTYQNSYPVTTSVQLEEPSAEKQSGTNDTIIKLEDPDCCLLDGEEFLEECEVHEVEPQWNQKREDILNKVLNVHSMINNEQQLKVFSNNIISLENVLRSLSKNDNRTNNSSSQKTKVDKHVNSIS